MSDSDSQMDAVEEQAPGKRARDPEPSIRQPTRRRSLKFRPSPTFFELADAVVKADRTLLGYDRLYAFWQCIGNVVAVPGAVAEIGSYRGGSAHFIASVFVSLTGAEVPMHVFDTFEGHPGESISEHDEDHTAGQFNSTSYQSVREFLSPFRELQLHKGEVSTSLPHIPESAYRLVHIDTDLYRPTLACLEYFGVRLSHGGVIVIDDYTSKRCRGVPKAVAEYLKSVDARHVFQTWDMRTEQLILVKR